MPPKDVVSSNPKVRERELEEGEVEVEVELASPSKVQKGSTPVVQIDHKQRVSLWNRVSKVIVRALADGPKSLTLVAQCSIESKSGCMNAATMVHSLFGRSFTAFLRTRVELELKDGKVQLSPIGVVRLEKLQNDEANVARKKLKKAQKSSKVVS